MKILTFRIAIVLLFCFMAEAGFAQLVPKGGLVPAPSAAPVPRRPKTPPPPKTPPAALQQSEETPARPVRVEPLKAGADSIPPAEKTSKAAKPALASGKPKA